MVVAVMTMVAATILVEVISNLLVGLIQLHGGRLTMAFRISMLSAVSDGENAKADRKYLPEDFRLTYRLDNGAVTYHE